MNIFFFLECPWKSRYRSTSWVYEILSTKFFRSTISGKRALELVLNSLLRSFPDAPQREFPKMTPSGLVIGTIMVKILTKTWGYFSLRNLA